MPKFKKPLSQHMFWKWGTNISGAAALDVDSFVDGLINDTVGVMGGKFGFAVKAEKTDITIGGLFGGKTFPGAVFSFADRSDWAGYLVGANKVAGVLSVDVVQWGSPSSAMQRMNVADAKGAFSISGALQRAITDQSAVEEEVIAYSALLQSVQEAVSSWVEQ